MSKLDGSRTVTTLEQWRPREERNVVDFAVYLRPERNPMVDREKIVEDITQEQERMKEYDEEHIEFLWRCRNTIAKVNNAYKWRQILWTELERRYEGVLRKPIEIKIPYLERIDIVKVKAYVTKKIDGQGWPEFLKEWHKKHFRVTTAGAQTISDILTNVNKPNWIKTGCRCRELKKTCPEAALVEGHVLMVGRDFKADEFKAMRVCAGNVPRHTWARTCSEHGTASGDSCQEAGANKMIQSGSGRCSTAHVSRRTIDVDRRKWKSRPQRRCTK